MAAPYVVGGTAATGSVLGNMAVVTLYRWVKQEIGQPLSTQELSTVVLTEQGVTVAGEVVPPSVPHPAPALQLSCSRVDFGPPTSSTSVYLRNTGTGTLTWTVQESDSWLRVSGPQGDTSGDGEFTGSGDVTLTVCTGSMGLADGVYEATIHITSNGGNVDLPVQMTVAGNGGSTAGEVRTFPLANGATMDFVWVPAGTFTMGSPDTEVGRWDNEGPQHQVTIRQGFWLGRTEVTQGQWSAVMGTAPWAGYQVWVRALGDYVPSAASNPAVYITWDDVQGLVHGLNVAAGDSLYRLPTEAEWEYTCRAASETRWSYGDDESQLGNYAWYRDNAWDAGLQYAQPVATKLPNGWGLYDMQGNVWEWVQDWYGDYTDGAQVDPQGPATGSYRVYRGGGFGNYAQDTRSAFRYGVMPDERNAGLGARLLRVATGSDGTPVLSVSPTSVVVGSGSNQTLVVLRNTGTGTLRWTVKKSEIWLGVSGPRGGTGGDGEFTGSGDVTLMVYTGSMGLADGVYGATIHITSNGGNVDLPVRMTVGSGSTGTAGEVRTFPLTNGATMDFVWIPPGTFTMGSPAAEIVELNSAGNTDWSFNEGPQHQVTISKGFWLGRTEVTQGQWSAVVGTTPWADDSYARAAVNNPAVDISWDDVQGLVHGLNVAVGDSLYRLPTEAEWEYACRAGTATRWSYGDDESQLGNYAWYDANVWNVGLKWAQPVATKLPNGWGLYDMHGNVREWVQDWYGGYSAGPQVDPPGPAAGSDRVNRGGCLFNIAQVTRSAYRCYNAPGDRGGSFGARLLRTR